MRAGQLRRRISFQMRYSGVDSYGQQFVNWADVLQDVPGDVQPLSGREVIAAQAVNMELSHTVTVRFHPLLTDPVKVAAMRALYSDGYTTHLLNLSSAVNVDARNRQIDIGALEGLNQG
jgi:SPP1 family predicted phage head-tail adaptor